MDSLGMLNKSKRYG